MFGRLKQLADFLDTLPVNRFRYSSFYFPPGHADICGEGLMRMMNDPACGTQACALGWAVTLWPAEWQVSAFDYPIIYADPKRNPFASAEIFFGITIDEACNLFHPKPVEAEATPAYVAEKIRKFIKEKINAGETGEACRLHDDGPT